MSESMPLKLARNFGVKCDNPSCQKVRHRIGRFCKTCNARYINHGAPNARRILPKEYQRELDLCRAFIAKHSETHEGLRNALAFIESLMPPDTTDTPPDNAATRPCTPPPPQGVPVLSDAVATLLRPQFMRLSDAGVTALDILVECAAIWLLFNWPTARLDDALPLTLALGNGVLHLGPRQFLGIRLQSSTGRKTFTYKLLPPRIKKATGLAIRQVLGTLLGNISRALVAEEAARDSFQHSMNAGFASTTPPPTTAHLSDHEKGHHQTTS